MATNWTQGVGNWVAWIPDFKGNRKSKDDDQVTMEIRIWNHKIRQDHMCQAKDIGADILDQLMHDDTVILKGVRNIKNLIHYDMDRDKEIQITTPELLLEYGSPSLINYIKTRIIQDEPLSEEEIKN